MYATSRPYAGQDDPARVDPPDGWTQQEERDYDRRYERLCDVIFMEYLDAATNVLDGRQTTARINNMTYDAGELYEFMTQDEETADLAGLLVGRAGVGEKLIKKFCYDQAERAAKRQMEAA